MNSKLTVAISSPIKPVKKIPNLVDVCSSSLTQSRQTMPQALSVAYMSHFQDLCILLQENIFASLDSI